MERLFTTLRVWEAAEGKYDNDWKILEISKEAFVWEWQHRTRSERCRCVPYEMCKGCAERCLKIDTDILTVKGGLFRLEETVEATDCPFQGPWYAVETVYSGDVAAEFRFETKAEHDLFVDDEEYLRHDDTGYSVHADTILMEKLLNRKTIGYTFQEEKKYIQLIFHSEESCAEHVAANFKKLKRIDLPVD